MTLDLKPEIAAALEALASAKGLSVEDKLASQGMIYPLTSLSGVVLGIVRRGQLGRMKEDGRWSYVSR